MARSAQLLGVKAPAVGSDHVQPELTASGEMRISELPEDVLPMRGDRVSEVPEGFPSELSRAVFYRPVGCEECTHTGYKGRIAISEMLLIDEAVRAEILNNSDAATIQRVATERGMRTLRADGARLVLTGVTSLEEVLAATQASELE